MRTFFQKQALLPLFCGVLLLSSCSNFFDKELDYNVDDHIPKLTIALSVLPTDTFINCFISRTRGLNDTSPYNSVVVDSFFYTDGSGDTIFYTGMPTYFDSVASVNAQVYRNGVFFGNLQRYNAMFYRNPSAPQLVAGDEWRVEVAAPNFEPIVATATVPAQPNIVKTTFIESVNPTNGESPYDLFEIELQDGPGNDFYIFAPEYIDTTTGQIYTDYNYSENPLFEYTPIGLVLPDATFKDQVFKMSVRVGYFDFPQSVKRYIKVINMTELAYRYLRSVEVANNTQNNPFAEPTAIVGNVQNGDGYFFIYNIGKKELVK